MVAFGLTSSVCPSLNANIIALPCDAPLRRELQSISWAQTQRHILSVTKNPRADALAFSTRPMRLKATPRPSKKKARLIIWKRLHPRTVPASMGWPRTLAALCWSAGRMQYLSVWGRALTRLFRFMRAACLHGALLAPWPARTLLATVSWDMDVGIARQDPRPRAAGVRPGFREMQRFAATVATAMNPFFRHPSSPLEFPNDTLRPKGVEK